MNDFIMTLFGTETMASEVGMGGRDTFNFPASTFIELWDPTNTQTEGGGVTLFNSRYIH